MAYNQLSALLLQLTALACLSHLLIAVSPGLLTDVCPAKAFQAECQEGQVIAMTSALYGRMSIGRCVKRSYNYIGCKRNVISIMDGKCSGKRECEIGVPDADLDRTAPCPEELRTYLSASYECMTVSTPSRSCESDSTRWVITGRSPIYISNSVAEETACATEVSPVEIRVLPGQQINITVFDFNTPYQEPTTSQYESNAHQYCDDFVIIYEYTTGKREKICPGTNRVRRAYNSSSHSVHVFFQKLASSNRERRLLLKFDAFGCGDIEHADDMFFRRDGNLAEIGCQKSKLVWTLLCDNSEWRGSYGNCSSAQGSEDSEDPGLQPEKNHRSSNLPYGVTIGVILSLALVIGLIFLVVGILCLRRSQNTRPIPPSISPQEDLEMKNMAQEIKFCPQHFPIMHPELRENHLAGCQKERDDYGMKPHLSNEYSPMQLHTFKRQAFPHHEDCREGLLSHDNHVHHTHVSSGNTPILMHAQDDNLHTMVQCVYSKGPRNLSPKHDTTQRAALNPPCDLAASTMQRNDRPAVPKKPINTKIDKTPWLPEVPSTITDSSLPQKPNNLNSSF